MNGSDDALRQVIGALSFAAAKHCNQRRKDVDASPYINHPIDLVAVLVNEAGICDAQVLCAALLHDTLEDTETSPEDLGERFGPGIRDLVLEVTDNKELPKGERKRLQVAHASALSEQARLVKLADKTCNLRDLARRPPADWSRERRQRYFDWAKQVVAGIRGVHPRLEALFDQAYAQRPPGG